MMSNAQSKNNISGVKTLEATFSNSNKLELNFVNHRFAGYEAADMWEVTFAERFEGKYGSDEVAEENEHYFMTANTEYFPNTPQGAKDASTAFFLRLNGDEAFYPTTLGHRLDTFLVKAKQEEAL